MTTKLQMTKLDQTLHNMGIDTLIVTGLTTDVCVTQTARETADRGFQVTIADIERRDAPRRTPMLQHSFWSGAKG
jgi:isochorismate hydrolase